MYILCVYLICMYYFAIFSSFELSKQFFFYIFIVFWQSFGKFLTSFVYFLGLSVPEID